MVDRPKINPITSDAPPVKVNIVVIISVAFFFKRSDEPRFG